jgi:phosphoglycerate kinase
MSFKDYFIENYSFQNRNVIIRVDWNIPFNDKYKIIDNFRIKSTLKTINFIIQQNPNRVIIISHLGRPKDKFDLKYSWKNFINQMKDFFPKIILLEDGLSDITIDKLKLEESNIYLLENIRFHEEETNFSIEQNKNIQKLFNDLGDIYINDAFSCMHRNHLSICGYTKNNNKGYGYLVKEEIGHINLILNNQNNEKILAVIGGSKIDDKIKLLENLSNQIDGIYITGGLINSILKNNKDKEFIKNIKKNRANIFEMKDGIASDNLKDVYDYYESINLPYNKYFYDIGLLSLIELDNIIKEYDIIFWNGPLGLIENDIYRIGSNMFIEILIKSKKRVIIGGGDTAAFVNKFENSFTYEFSNKFEYISTAGGALIDYISNKTLIGLEYFNYKI